MFLRTQESLFLEPKIETRKTASREVPPSWNCGENVTLLSFYPHRTTLGKCIQKAAFPLVKNCLPRLSLANRGHL